jgi:hypothetical protein
MAALREIIAQAQDTLVTRSEKQAGLSRRWLEPALPELLRLIQVHRQTVDEEFRLRLRIALADAALAVGETGVALYPVGYCQHIRDAVWARLQNEKLIQEFRRRGLWWKKIYFIGDGAHFQNAIQLGDYLLDVAHNTIDANAEPVVCAPLGEVEYENLDDWVRYAEIAETYYHCRLFPNYYFPLAFPLCPVPGYSVHRAAGTALRSRPAVPSRPWPRVEAGAGTAGIRVVGGAPPAGRRRKFAGKLLPGAGRNRFSAGVSRIHHGGNGANARGLEPSA